VRNNSVADNAGLSAFV